MMNTKQLIDETVSRARTLPSPKIEYNFDELPEGYEPDNFKGIPAFKNEDRKKGTINIIYKFK